MKKETKGRSITVSDTESVSDTPPVPPRRKKRKEKLVTIATSPEGTSATRLKKSSSSRKRVAPPAPPPRAARRIKPRIAVDQSEESKTSSIRSTSDIKETLNSSTETGETFEDSTEKTMTNSNDRCDRNHPLDRRSFVFEKFPKTETNKYPSLFFTWHDFQNVIPDNTKEEEEADSADKSSMEFSNSIRESFENSLNEDENELCFRVTTTNFPFEKCLDRWSNKFADHFMESFDEPNRFIFEDYIDRSNKVNVRKSSRPMCYEDLEEEAVVPRLTKVRFVIESPSSSTPDYELDENGEGTCDSLQNIDPIIDEEENILSRVTGVQLTEITEDMDWPDDNTNIVQGKVVLQDPEEFKNVPLCSILKTRNDSIELSTLEDVANFFETSDILEDVVSKDLILASNPIDSRDESLLFTWTKDCLKTIDLSEEDTNRGFMLADVRIECSDKLPQDDFIETTNSNNVEDNKTELFDGTHGNRETVSEDSNEICCVDNDKSETEGNLTIDNSVNREENLETNIELPTINENKIPCLLNQEITNELENSESHSSFDKAETLINDGKTGKDKEQVIKMESNDKSMSEYKRKLFANETLRNVRKHDEISSNDIEEESEKSVNENYDSNHQDSSSKITKENSKEYGGNEIESCSNTENSRDSRDSFKSVEYFQSKESITVPVNVRRNSFLENMLSEDVDQVWTSCEIVQTHPKLSEIQKETFIKSKRDEDVSDQLNEPSIHSILQHSKASLKKATGTRITTKSMIQPSEKSAGDVKCEVLNELLTNFSKIQLKPATAERKSSIAKCEREISSIQLKNVEEKLETNLETEKRSSTDDMIKVKDSSEEKGHLSSFLTEKQTNSSQDLKKQEEENCFSLKIAINDQIEKKRSCESSPNRAEESSNTLQGEERTKTKDRLISSTNNDQTQSRSNGNDIAKNLFVEDSIDGEKPADYSTKRSFFTKCGEKTEAEYASLDRKMVTRRLELSREINKGDKSAIAKRIPRSHFNNNDNNRAVTPVAVSDDQTIDTVTITPGRVRNFVKYYEIQRGTTNDGESKFNDIRLDKSYESSKTGSVVSIRRSLEARTIETVDSRRKDYDPSSGVDCNNCERLIGSRIKYDHSNDKEKVDISSGSNHNVDRLIEDDYVIVKRTEKNETIESVCDSSVARFEQKARRKKSVKFEGEFTVIGKRNPDEDGSAGSLRDRNVAKLSEKKKAPDRPALKASDVVEKVDFQSEELMIVEPSPFQEPETAAKTKATMKDEERSGIKQFVQKSETPRLVFYCTV